MTGFHCKPGRLSDGFLEPSPHPVSLDGIAVLLGDGKADARGAFGISAIENFQEERPAAPAFARAHGNKLRPAFQPPDRGSDFRLTRHRPVIGHSRPLGRETLAAARATSCKNLAAAIGGHTGTETVTALADKLRRLRGTLRHLFNTGVCGPSGVCFESKSVMNRPAS